MQKDKKVLILASGNGTNALNLWKHMSKTPGYKALGVFCNNEKALINKKTKELNIPCYLHDSKHENYHEKLQTLLLELKPDWLLLAGYMKILPKNILELFRSDLREEYQVINIHPSLLPLYPGLNAFEKAFHNKDRQSGITVHFVDEGMDSGKIIIQESFPRQTKDSLDDFIHRGQKVEQKLYPKAIDEVILADNTK